MGAGGGGIKRFSLSEANREGVHRSARDFFFFIFSFLCSLTVSPFLMLSPLTTEPDPRLHHPFHIGTFFPSQLNKLFSWTNIPVERAVLPSKIEHKLKLEPGC